jgi:hypothetical protein
MKTKIPGIKNNTRHKQLTLLRYRFWTATKQTSELAAFFFIAQQNAIVRAARIEARSLCYADYLFVTLLLHCGTIHFMEAKLEQPNGIKLFDPIADAMIFVGLKLTGKEKLTATPMRNNGENAEFVSLHFLN